MTDKRAELVERMARAIYACEYDADHYSLETTDDLNKRLLRNQASAALDIALAEAAKVAFDACACNGAAGAIRSLMSKP